MPSPFPGMDPFLEDPAVFPDLHNRLIAHLSEAINAKLPPPYFTAIANRVWVESARRRVEPDVNVLHPPGLNGGPKSGGGVALADAIGLIRISVPAGEEVREPFLEIHADPGGERLVTTVEVLSLANKSYSNHGRAAYLAKQGQILACAVNLVEIDLLRGGTHTTAVPPDRFRAETGGAAYHVCIHCADTTDAFVLPVPLERPLPRLPVPLLPGDPAVTIDLQPVLDRAYDGGLYGRRLDYRRPVPGPPLPPEQARWADQLLRSRGLLPAGN